jgi:hypothetical protein
MVVADLRSGHRSTKIVSAARILKREREETERDCCNTNLKKNHTNLGVYPRDLDCWVLDI